MRHPRRLTAGLGLALAVPLVFAAAASAGSAVTPDKPMPDDIKPQVIDEQAEQFEAEGAVLTAKSTSVAVRPWEKITVTGLLTPAKGKVRLQAWRKLGNGAWAKFPAHAHTRANGQYTIWLKTARVGVNQFMVSTTRGTKSNPVTVLVNKKK